VSVSEVLYWALGEINHQVEYADLVLTRQGIKQLVIEAKRPGALAWNRRAVEAALSQARRYADEQRVQRVAVSDGYMLYAADIEHGGLQDRVFIDLGAQDAQEALWWLSVQGMYRPCREAGGAVPRLLPEPAADEPVPQAEAVNGLPHPSAGFQRPASATSARREIRGRGSSHSEWPMVLSSRSCRSCSSQVSSTGPLHPSASFRRMVSASSSVSTGGG
jgi:hypothetical protein